jgi:cysteine sulfinate desulfinase/cysteine desulfurase-like protein
VLLAIGVKPELASAAIRMSLGSLTNDECIDRVAQVFGDLVRKARQLTAAT